MTTAKKPHNTNPKSLENLKNHSYKKGFTGNPNGRPKKGTALTDILNVKLDEIDPDSDNALTKREMIANKLIQIAKEGDMVAIKYLWDRIDGKPLEKVMSEISHSLPTIEVLPIASKDTTETTSSTD